MPGVDLFTDMAGIRSPNPFWLASCPITNNGEMVAARVRRGLGRRRVEDHRRARSATSPRASGTFDYGGQRIVGINNIELISDRPTEVNIAEIAEVKRRYPDNAVVDLA